MTLNRWREMPKSKRVSRRFAARRNPAFMAWLRTLPCLITGHRTGTWIDSPKGPWRRRCIRVEACHVLRGNRANDDVGGCVPMDWSLHREEHRGRKSFEKKHGVDLADAAREYGERWTTEHPTLHEERSDDA